MAGCFSSFNLFSVGYGDICPGNISWLGRTFIVFLSFLGLGMFCGPIMDLAASWKDRLPLGGTMVLFSSTVTTGVLLFCYLLGEMTETEAVYFSIITGVFPKYFVTSSTYIHDLNYIEGTVLIIATA